MTITQHINHGWDGIKKSFKLVWQNKILVIYIVAPIALSGFIKVLFNKIAVYFFGPDLVFGLATTYPYIFVVVPFLLLIMYAFAGVSATYHVLAILNQQPASLSASIKAAWGKIRYIIILAIITQMFNFISSYMYMMLWNIGADNLTYIPYLLWAKDFMSLAALFVHFLSFYIITAIALSNNSFITMVKNSMRYAWATWIEIIVGWLVILPTNYISTVARHIPVAYDWKINMLVYQFITLPLSGLIIIVAQTAFLVYKTIMYIDTKKELNPEIVFTQAP